MRNIAAMLLLSCLVIVGGCTKSQEGPPKTVTAPAAATPAVNPAMSQDPNAGIPWLTKLDQGFTQAKAVGHPVMVDFFAEWCGPCKMLDAQTWPDKRVVEEAKNFVPVRINIDEQQSLAQQYDIEAIPTVVFMDASGKVLKRNTGFIDADQMLALMKSVK